MVTTTRFAPSPTGRIHLGNARTALFNWLIARHDGGRFLIRIEDTDAARNIPGGIEAVLDDLAWLGLESDTDPVRQSAQREVHSAKLDELAAAGQLYSCFCTEAQLALSRKAQSAQGKPPRYAGTCANLDPAEAATRIADGVPHTLRFRVPAGRTVAFEDRVHGSLSFLSDDIGDFVVRRSDGSLAFFFANAVDDALAGVTLVLRGEDHLSNTPRQKLILEALGLPVPSYGHLPLMLDSEGVKLSKRLDAFSVASLRHQGYHPLAVVNYLARIGGHVKQDGPLPMDALAYEFDTERFVLSAGRFDEQQLLHWQRVTLDALPADALWTWMDAPVHERVPSEQKDAWIATVRPNALFPGDALDWAFVCFDDEPMPQKEAILLMQETGPGLFKAALAAYDDGLDWNTWSTRVREHTGLKGAALFKPLRAAVTGRLDGPGMSELMALISPARIRSRLIKGGAGL